MERQDVVGEIINFRGMIYAPTNEQGVVFLFGKVIEDLNMYIELIRTGYPDCIGRRFIGKGWEKVAVEFEYKSSSFVRHKHDPAKCDIIVCWEHDWPDCPIEVLELREIIKELPPIPISEPPESGKSKGLSLEEHFQNRNSSKKMIELYHLMDKKISSVDESIWRKIGKWRISFLSPERVFFIVKVQKTQIKIYSYTGDSTINGVENPWDDDPEWGRIILKDESDLRGLKKIVQESFKNINNAYKKNLPTGGWGEDDDTDNEDGEE